MKVFPPQEVAKHNGSKYQGVLVAAEYAKELNRLPSEPLGDQKKLTTRALEAITSGQVDYSLADRKPTETE